MYWANHLDPFIHSKMSPCLEEFLTPLPSRRPCLHSEKCLTATSACWLNDPPTHTSLCICTGLHGVPILRT